MPQRSDPLVLLLDEVHELQAADPPGGSGPGLRGGLDGQEAEEAGGQGDGYSGGPRSHAGIIGLTLETKGRAVPRSKSKRSRYHPPPKPKPKPSPGWLGPSILIILLLALAVLVFNYAWLGPRGESSNLYLWGGLGLIALGFGAATQLR